MSRRSKHRRFKTRKLKRVSGNTQNPYDPTLHIKRDRNLAKLDSFFKSSDLKDFLAIAGVLAMLVEEETLDAVLNDPTTAFSATRDRNDLFKTTTIGIISWPSLSY